MATTAPGPDALLRGAAPHDLLAQVPTQRAARRSALVEADPVSRQALLAGPPVRLATILAAALPELTGAAR